MDNLDGSSLGAMLDSTYDQTVADKLNTLNEQMRAANEHLGRISKFPQVRTKAYNSGGYTNAQAVTHNLHGRAIKAVYIENQSGSTVEFCIGPNANGIPFVPVNSGTWRTLIMPDDTFDVSFIVPAAGLGPIILTLSDSPNWQPGMGNIV